MCTAALFTKAKLWKQPEYPSTDEWIQKMSHTDTIDYYSAIKKNGILPFANIWLFLQNVIFREIRQRKIILYVII